MKEKLIQLIEEGMPGLESFVVEHPSRLAFGDYSTNAGILTPHIEDLVDYIDKHKPTEVERIEVNNGFINFYLSKKFFADSLADIIKKGEDFGKNESLKGEKVIVEHTDPNPFKEFHIGHLMPNVLGSTLARLYEWNGAEVKQACYQGDVGLHVAKALWKGDYVLGSKAYEDDEQAKVEIHEINKKIYNRSDPELNKRYDEGRKKSLEYFDSIYKKLKTNFDYFFFESEVAEFGKKIVLENPGTFVESQGAVVFNGEDHGEGLHTRVFINSEGLPTYEAKELGLAKLKFETYPYTKSVVVTGNEINDYFKVLLAAMKLVFPDLAAKTKHISHGMLRLPTGKMSSRTGDIITFEELLAEVREKVQDNEEVAIGAIKYMILRSSVGSDIIFDIDKSVSTEGDSGVYLQYAYARTNSLLEKAGKKGSTKGESGEVREVEKLLYRFPEVVERAMKEYAPHHIVTYLIELSGAFNNFYAHEQVISDAVEAPYRLAIVEAFKIVLKNGLNILGIPAPERM